MDPIHVLKKPHITEKATFAMNEDNQYTFLVDPRATKGDIKAAVESVYNVRVQSVNTRVHKGKNRRLRYGYVTGAKQKTATVRLHADDQIELF